MEEPCSISIGQEGCKGCRLVRKAMGGFVEAASKKGVKNKWGGESFFIRLPVWLRISALIGHAGREGAGVRFRPVNVKLAGAALQVPAVGAAGYAAFHLLMGAALEILAVSRGAARSPIGRISQAVHNALGHVGVAEGDVAILQNKLLYNDALGAALALLIVYTLI